MEQFDSLRRGDQVTITIFGPDGGELYKSTGSDYHSLDTAINSVLENANLNINPEDCVFEVTNNTTGVSHRYRLNAHGHLKLII